MVFGPRGVGKTMLAKFVVSSLPAKTHTVRLYGTGLSTAVAYGAWGVFLARLDNAAANSPLSIIQGIAELIVADADGREILLVVDDVGKIDSSSIAVLMHLVLSGTARLLVLARTTSELPEDLVWLLKDRQLDRMTLQNFTKAEVRELLTQGLGGRVAGAVVEFLHAASGGNPLILHALVHEEISRGRIVAYNNIWILDQELHAAPSSLLDDLVEARLSRESAEVRRGLEKMALIENAPLDLVIDALGSETVAELEILGFLHISPGERNYTSLVEPHIGETVRARMSPENKRLIYQELQSLVTIQPESLPEQELLIFGAWATEAGISLEPDTAIAAAKMAVKYFDPLLALKLTSLIDKDSVAGPHAAIVRSGAYSILADYSTAVKEMEASSAVAESRLEAEDYAQWVAAFCNSLLWVDGGPKRASTLIDSARDRLALKLSVESTEDDSQESRRRRVFDTLSLAKFHYQVHEGMFAESASGLEDAYRSTGDHEYRLESGSLLVTVWAATGRELDAIALAHEIERESKESQTSSRYGTSYTQGLIFALIWSGQWRKSVETVEVMLSHMRKSTEFHGGIAELGIGIAYTYAGRGVEAADILVVAAAQLERRDVYHCTRLAYAALAFAFAQVEDTAEAERYLIKAAAISAHTSWINEAVTKFFLLMARRWMDIPRATDKLIESAAEDQEAGRYTLAAMSLFGATVVNGQEKYLRQLAEVAAQRQGPMAQLTATLAIACLEKDPVQALAAAKLAEELDLAAVESRCAVVGLDLARQAGHTRLAREAVIRIDRLRETIPVMPLEPQTEGERLTQRERQVAKLAGRGLGNRAIAELMGVSVRTIEGHLYQVFSKFGIQARSELSQID